MKQLSLDDRPREKMLRHGASALGDNELIALVIGSGSRRAGALDVANEVLDVHGGIHGLTRATPDTLSRVAGIGRAKAAQIVAALEIGRRTLVRPPAERPQLINPLAAAQYLLPLFGSRATEQFGIVLLDTKHRVIRTAILVSGTDNACIVAPREVYREAARGGASAIAVFHNHPSGDPAPSADDVALTRRLAAAGLLMGIDLVDHIILGEQRYYSFKEARAL
jgi:DNA repair protein RadC